MDNLVLSTFTGAGLLDRGFRAAGYCVVCTGDPIFGQEGLQNFHPPAGVFAGIIAGPPCQRWAKSQEFNGKARQLAQHPNLIPVFERIIAEARPQWFLMENVQAAPRPNVPGYDTDSSVIYAEELGAPQRRPRRFTFGSNPPKALLWPSGARGNYRLTFTPGHGPWGDDGRGSTRRRYSIAEFLDAFGLESSWDAPALTIDGKRRVLGQGVPFQVAHALAVAIRRATYDPSFEAGSPAT